MHLAKLAPEGLLAESRTFSPRRLVASRRGAGMTREQVAVAIARSWTSVKQYERGVVIPPAPVLARLADVLGCTIDDFFEAPER